MTENDLIELLDHHDTLVMRYVDGHITGDVFLAEYGGFVERYALDGHEADQSELALFSRYESRIAPHQEISKALGPVCSEKDWLNPLYRQARRYPVSEMRHRLLPILARYPERFGHALLSSTSNNRWRVP